MNLIAEARALMALLAPLTGERAAGTLVVSAAPGPGAVLPPSSFAIPILGGAARYDLLLKTAVNPASDEGWPVFAGTAVPVVANVGGLSGNLPIGTSVRWFPSIAGVEPVSVVGPGVVGDPGIAGGTAPEGLTAVRQVAFFEELGAATGAEMLSRALVARFPAIVLAWESTGESTFVGRGQQTQKQTWSLYVVTSRQDADPARRLEGMAILDAATAAVIGRTGVDGFTFSAPAGVDIVGRQLVTISDAFYVYRIRLSTQTAMNYRELRAFNPWLTTRLDAAVPAPAPAGLPVVIDHEIEMPQAP